MSYDLQTTDEFDKAFKKLDRYTQRMRSSGLTKI